MLQMLELGILTDSDMEFMIDRIMLSGTRMRRWKK